MIRLGIVGTNFISDTFVASTSEEKDLTLQAVASGHRENAEKFAQKYNIPSVYDSLDEMLQAKAVDAVYIASPNALHVPMTKLCVEHHVPVLTEKPFAINEKEAAAVFALAAKNNVLVQDAIVPLYTKNLQILKQAIGTIGTIRRVFFNYSRYSSRYDAYRAGKNPTTFRYELCNGTFMDLGVYCLADLVSLFGEPEVIQSHAVKLASGVDGTSSAIVSYPDFDGIVMASKISTSAFDSEIEGEDGTIRINNPGILTSIVRIDRVTTEEKELAEPCPYPMAAEIHDFLENIKEGRTESQIVPHALTLSILHTLDLCRYKAGIRYAGETEGETL